MVKEKSIQVSSSTPIQQPVKIVVSTPRDQVPQMVAVPSKQLILNVPEDPMNSGIVKVQLQPITKVNLNTLA